MQVLSDSVEFLQHQFVDFLWKIIAVKHVDMVSTFLNIEIV